MTVTDPVANVTIATTPDLVRRRRENLGKTRARGVELEAESALAHGLVLNAAAQFVDSVVVDYAADPSLEGKRVAQVPDGQATLGLTWRGTATTATIVGRWTGTAWEDDRNTLRLDPFTTVDAEVARRLAGELDLVLAAENLLDEEYVVGRAGVTTVGTPRLVRLGVRWRRGGATIAPP